MNIDIQTYSGESLAVEIGILADFRLRYFREFPYLYVGTEEGEREHIAEYIANPTARLLVARDGKKTIGVAIGTMLSTESGILHRVAEPLRQGFRQKIICQKYSNWSWLEFAKKLSFPSL